jgi:hypothetical protein
VYHVYIKVSGIRMSVTLLFETPFFLKFKGPCFFVTNLSSDKYRAIRNTDK